MRILQIICHYQILLIFHKAEWYKIIDLYFCGMCLSLPLLAFANAPNHVSLLTTTLRYWDEASKMGRAIITRYYFTMKRTIGANIEIDFGHENP